MRRHCKDEIMINSLEQFGRNAGKLWQILEEHGQLTKEKIQEKTQLRSYEIEIAIGWLAREDKISFDDNQYKISLTNLTGIIGNNAGIIWKALHKNGECNINTLIKETSLPKHKIYEAIGWLAREDKLGFSSLQGD